MVTQMELYLGSKEKCRRVQLLKHFDPGSTGASLVIARAKGCCDCCTIPFFRVIYSVENISHFLVEFQLF